MPRRFRLFCNTVLALASTGCADALRLGRLLRLPIWQGLSLKF